MNINVKMNLLNQLKRQEGLKLHPYRCSSDKLTIGYGRNLDDTGISITEAEIMLDDDIYRAECEVKRMLPFYGELDDARKSVLVNMCFNMGIKRLMSFKKMIQFIRIGDYKNAADEMLDSRWASQVGKRALDLSEQMRTGLFQ